MSKVENNVTFDSYIKNISDQSLKGLLLKLKNETRKEDANWHSIKIVLKKIQEYDTEVFNYIVPLIILED